MAVLFIQIKWDFDKKKIFGNFLYLETLLCLRFPVIETLQLVFKSLSLDPLLSMVIQITCKTLEEQINGMYGIKYICN